MHDAFKLIKNSARPFVYGNYNRVSTKRSRAYHTLHGLKNKEFHNFQIFRLTGEEE